MGNDDWRGLHELHGVDEVSVYLDRDGITRITVEILGTVEIVQEDGKETGVEK